MCISDTGQLSAPKRMIGYKEGNKGRCQEDLDRLPTSYGAFSLGNLGQAGFFLTLRRDGSAFAYRGRRFSTPRDAAWQCLAAHLGSGDGIRESENVPSVPRCCPSMLF
jgi:hypothetical protein